MIDITLLGVSALLPLPDRALTAAVLRCGGHSILFDCGEGTQTAARKAGVSLMGVDLIALTHYHGDHTFGLPGLMQTMGVMDRTQPLYITGPQGLEDALTPILTLAGDLPFPVRCLTLPEEGLVLRSVLPGWPELARLMPVSTRHRVPSQGYRFSLGRAGKFDPHRAQALQIPLRLWSVLQSGQSVIVNGAEILPQQVLGPQRAGLSFVFTGDTVPCDSLVRAARDADLMICEATYGEDGQADLAAQYGHMTFAQAGEVAARAHVRRLWLAHFSQRIADPATCLPSAHAHYPGAECGRDGEHITLSYPPDA